MDAACWSMMALMQALPEAKAPAHSASFPQPATQPWMNTAAFGTAAELKALLDRGLDPNSKTPEGTTLLMTAAHDPEMVKLLVARGADVKAKAKNGFTAIMVAAGYNGVSESVRILLDHGAEARSGTGVFFNASPLSMAVLSGDADVTRLLLAKGADPNRRMNLIGMFPASPLMSAVGFGDAPLIAMLAKSGAKVDERDPDQLTLLHWAVIANHPDAAKALIAAGASPNVVDKVGYTPLHYASAIDFGNPDTVKALVAAGADRSIKTKDGKTAAQTVAAPYLADALK
jgi:ankyrin repeat protein